MMDCYGREINYLRVSVTDRCNLRCQYCMPAEGIQDSGHERILTFEQIIRLVKLAAECGVRKVRFTGGEPLVRKDIVKLIEAVSSMPGMQDVSLTTNGICFADMADDLKRAGLVRVNFSLDSLHADRFRYITRLGNISDVWRSIEKALAIGMMPVKINTVVMKGVNDDEILDFARLAAEMPVHVRFIEFMPVGDLPFYQEERLVNMDEVKRTIKSSYQLLNGLAGRGNGPAKVYQIAGGKGTIGFISAMSNHFCGDCNRIRLTADGRLRSCLFDKREINVKAAMDRGTGDDRLAIMIRQAIREKPDRHHMEKGWGADNSRKMYQIGG